MDRVGYGIIGTGFIADLHAHALKVVPEANLLAVASPSPGKARRFADERRIPHAYQDYRELLARPDIQLVSLALPNDLWKNPGSKDRTSERTSR
jgi:myo-inositol 2-dehydrogenase / D-chiro-inositol 1-dehydrogenase